MKTHSDKLKEAMAEINAILNKHDIGGYIMLHEPGFSEFRTRIDPSWSIARFQSVDGREAIRVRALAADFGGDIEANRKALGDTINMLVHFRDHAERTLHNMEQVLKILSNHAEFTNTEGVTTPVRNH